MKLRWFAPLAWILLAARLAAQDLPAGYWNLADSQPILDKSLVVRLAPDLSDLTPREQRAVDKLLIAGHTVQRISIIKPCSHKKRSRLSNEP